jgi:hypothetical protein
MYLTIAIIVGLLVAIPGGIFWLLRPRKDVKPGPFHQNDDIGAYSPGNDASHPP